MNKAFVWSFLTNYCGIAVNLLSVVVLARLLSPSEIGTYAIAGAVFAIGQMFRDMGISGYLLREQDLTEEKVNGALVIVWGLCSLIAFLLYSLSSVIADFYANTDLKIIFEILSINILLIPLGTVSQTFLRREMNFKTLGIIEIFSQIIHFVIAVTLALNDFGAMSLAFASLSATVCTLICVNCVYKTNIIYRPKVKNVRLVLPNISMIGFANILTTINSRATPLIIGKVISEHAIAIMDKALATIDLLNQLLMQAIQKVLLPFFTKVGKNKDGIRDVYLTITNYTLLVGLPFLFYVSVLADFVVLTLFGDQWLEAVPLIPIFALAQAFGALVRYFNEAAISLGLEKKLIRLNLNIVILTISSVLFVSPYGILSLAYGLLAVSIIRAGIVLYFLRKHLSIGFRDWAMELKETLIVLIISTIPYWLGQYWGVMFTEFLEVLFLFVIVLSIWCCSLFLVKHKARFEIIKLMTRNPKGHES